MTNDTKMSGYKAHVSEITDLEVDAAIRTVWPLGNPNMRKDSYDRIKYCAAVKIPRSIEKYGISSSIIGSIYAIAQVVLSSKFADKYRIVQTQDPEISVIVRA